MWIVKFYIFIGQALHVEPTHKIGVLGSGIGLNLNVDPSTRLYPDPHSGLPDQANLANT